MANFTKQFEAYSRTQSLVPEKQYVTASELLVNAADIIDNRANERDKPNGERSMKRCVDTFNAMTGHALTEVDGWLFMQYLKHSRSREGAFRQDDYDDDIAYSALKAEAAINRSK